jgi:RNA polymerase sigma-70 factor (ECF subfamily)
VPDVTETAAVEIEASLLRRAQDGDEAAFGEVMRANYERVFRRVVAIVRNEHDARDVSQEIWLSVWKNLKAYRGEAKFSTWLYAVATRRSIDHLRRRRRWFDRFLPFLADGEPPAASEPTAASSSNPRRELETKERDERFERALVALPPKHRSVLALREVEGLSYEEIAQTLNCRPGTVMSRLYHARRLLAQKLENLP